MELENECRECKRPFQLGENFCPICGQKRMLIEEKVKQMPFAQPIKHEGWLAQPCSHYDRCPIDKNLHCYDNKPCFKINKG